MRIAIGTVLVCLMLCISRERWLMAIGNFLIIEDQLHPADVIHVIAGEDYRTNYAIRLYRMGYAKTIFFTGGRCTFHGYYHGLHGQELSLYQGVPPEAIAFDESSVTSTYMEAERLKEWISKSPIPIHSVIVVSDPFHMRRVRWTYRKVLGDEIDLGLAPVPFEQTTFQEKWWENPESKRYVIDEYQKLIYYIARYQLSWGALRDWLASLDQE